MDFHWSTENIQAALVWTILVVFLGLRFFRFHRVKRQIPKLLAEGATVLDVRSENEYQAGSRPGSLNIPLYLVRDELKSKEELQKELQAEEKSKSEEKLKTDVGDSKKPIKGPLKRATGRLHGYDVTKPIIVCCSTGTRAAIAATALRRAGFQRVYNAGPWKNTLTSPKR